MSPDTTTPATPVPASDTKKITRDDIEKKLRELRGEVDEQVESAKIPAIAIAVGAAVATVVVAYWLGRRRGRKRQTVLEIRRI